jgi:hypothetical protein
VCGEMALLGYTGEEHPIGKRTTNIFFEKKKKKNKVRARQRCLCHHTREKNIYNQCREYTSLYTDKHSPPPFLVVSYIPRREKNNKKEKRISSSFFQVL